MIRVMKQQTKVEALEQEYVDEKGSWEAELLRGYWIEIQKTKPKYRREIGQYLKSFIHIYTF
jgi:hypothetical protein